MKIDTDMAILVIVGVLSIAMFCAIVYIGRGPEHGPSMYEDSKLIRDGPL